MFNLISVLIIIVCILLVLVVLVQNSKGGGLAANFGASNQVMGVRRTADFLEKATWTLAAVLLALCILASWAIEKPSSDIKTRMDEESPVGTAAPGINIPAEDLAAPFEEEADE